MKQLLSEAKPLPKVCGSDPDLYIGAVRNNGVVSLEIVNGIQLNKSMSAVEAFERFGHSADCLGVLTPDEAKVVGALKRALTA